MAHYRPPESPFSVAKTDFNGLPIHGMKILMAVLCWYAQCAHTNTDTSASASPALLSVNASIASESLPVHFIDAPHITCAVCWRDAHLHEALLWAPSRAGAAHAGCMASFLVEARPAVELKAAVRLAQHLHGGCPPGSAEECLHVVLPLSASADMASAASAARSIATAFFTQFLLYNRYAPPAVRGLPTSSALHQALYRLLPQPPLLPPSRQDYDFKLCAATSPALPTSCLCGIPTQLSPEGFAVALYDTLTVALSSEPHRYVHAPMHVQVHSRVLAEGPAAAAIVAALCGLVSTTVATLTTLIATEDDAARAAFEPAADASALFSATNAQLARLIPDAAGRSDAGESVAATQRATAAQLSAERLLGEDDPDAASGALDRLCGHSRALTEQKIARAYAYGIQELEAAQNAIREAQQRVTDLVACLHRDYLAGCYVGPAPMAELVRALVALGPGMLAYAAGVQPPLPLGMLLDAIEAAAAPDCAASWVLRGLEELRDAYVRPGAFFTCGDALRVLAAAKAEDAEVGQDSLVHALLQRACEQPWAPEGLGAACTDAVGDNADARVIDEAIKILKDATPCAE